MSQGVHPKHPPCPSCSRALYKSPVKGAAVKKSDPWAFCRNKKCASFERNLAERTTAPQELAPDKHTERAVKSRANGKATIIPSPPDEPVPVQKARARIRELLAKVVEGKTPTTVGITLALVSQETGNHAAANALIDEYNLSGLLGIQKVGPYPPDEKKSKKIDTPT